MQPASLPINYLNVGQLAERKREREKQTSVASPKVLALPRISSIYPDARRAQSQLSMTNSASKESPLSPGYPGTNAQALITNQPICSQSIVPPTPQGSTVEKKQSNAN
ncbi:hypothetical protein V8C40DRAFT_241414 [Trichoderma camerunense]